MFASEEIIEFWKEQIEICPDTESTECALSYLKDRVRRSYRREPLDEEWQVFEDIILHWGLEPKESLPLALQALLQSPQFLYIYPSRQISHLYLN